MTLKLIKIGSSRGVRLPKKLIEKYGFSDELEMELRKEGLLLKKSRHPRNGWQKKIFDELGSDINIPELIPGDLTNEFDDSEWQW